jgi:hypothetical protein
MSKYNNVNPDHYKVAGREHPGDGLHQERNKRELKMEEKALERQKKRGVPRKKTPTRTREK